MAGFLDQPLFFYGRKIYWMFEKMPLWTIVMPDNKLLNSSSFHTANVNSPALDRILLKLSCIIHIYDNSSMVWLFHVKRVIKLRYRQKSSFLVTFWNIFVANLELSGIKQISGLYISTSNIMSEVPCDGIEREKFLIWKTPTLQIHNWWRCTGLDKCINITTKCKANGTISIKSVSIITQIVEPQGTGFDHCINSPT